MVKFTFAALCCLVVGIISSAVHGLEDVHSTSTCNSIHDESACKSAVDEDTNEACVWCTSKAVASVCVNEDQSKIVPPAVFHCDVDEKKKMENDNDEEDDDGESKSFSYEFHGKEGIEYHLNVKEHAAKTKTSLLNDELNDNDDDDLCDGSSKSIAGYMDIKGSKYDDSGENKHLFFWMFEKRPSKENETTETIKDDEIPLIVWLTGGPGCSSTLALLTENGPCKVNKDGETTYKNEFSWTESAHVLWLDQPAGVGFSYGDVNDKNEEMIAEDAYYFMQAFYTTYPEYLKNPLYIVGESYGGHYAPAIAHRIFVGNQNDNVVEDVAAVGASGRKLRSTKSDQLKINLSGLGIGNGLTSPEEQYKWYPDMMYNNSHHIEIINKAEYNAMKDNVVPHCTSLIHTCNKGESMVDKFACQTAFLVCNAGLTSPYTMTGLNPYDIREKCKVRPLCYDFSHVDHWLNLERVQKSLNVHGRPHHWASCNFDINMQFHEDWMKDFSNYVAVLLNANIPVLIYAGDVDFICNYMGNKAWTLNLEWKQSNEFQSATDHDWNNGSGLARTTSSNGLFTFLQVHDAGHMVPSDQPKVALEMITNFINGGKF